MTRVYGQWSGNERGTPEDPKRCIAEVYPQFGWIPRQCERNRGNGPDGLYCKQHGKKQQLWLDAKGVSHD